MHDTAILGIVFSTAAIDEQPTHHPSQHLHLTIKTLKVISISLQQDLVHSYRVSSTYITQIQRRFRRKLSR